ncbi:MAG: hypothetical protein QXF10_04210 [Ignisphaera sp.]
MKRHVILGLYYVATTLMLTVLIAQVVFLASVLLSIIGLGIPLINISGSYCENNSCVVSYHGNPHTIIPLSTLSALLTTYSIHKKQSSKSYKTRLFLYGVLITIVILAAVFIAVYLATCGLACPLLTCKGDVEECSVSISWLFVTLNCKCR